MNQKKILRTIKNNFLKINFRLQIAITRFRFMRFWFSTKMERFFRPGVGTKKIRVPAFHSCRPLLLTIQKDKKLYELLNFLVKKYAPSE